jgi:alanine racemase
MRAESGLTVSIDLQRIRKNAEAILARTGVPIIAVIKADAYGLGAAQVAATVKDLVEAFYVFDAREAVAARLWEITARRTIALHSPWPDARDFLSQHIQPVVWSIQRAEALRAARPVLSIDTGQQRFACTPEEAAAVCAAGDCQEAMTHAVTLPQVDRFLQASSVLPARPAFLHASGSALLDQPSAWLNAVRPGLALYRGAARVSSRLIEVRDSAGPAGYSGFTADRFGVIFGGYSHGIRKGPCKINGMPTRVLEVGMQSSFVQLHAKDRVGDEVLLLADEAEIDESAVAKAWSTSEQEVLVRLTGSGLKRYI